MRSLIEQRFNIQFCFKLGIPCTETFGMLSKVYQNHCMSCSHCFEWVKRLKTGQFVEVEEHGNRPSTATDICYVEEMRAKVLENGRFDELAEQCNFSEDSVHTLLIEYVDMHRVSGYSYQGSQRTLRNLKSNKSFGFQTNEGIDYEKLLKDVFLSTDRDLCQKLIAKGEDSGTTAIVAMIQGTRLIVANAGDSRGVMCDSDGFAVPLSFDHKPESEEETKRIIAAGGKVIYSSYAYRVDGYLATSRALGNCLWKPQNRIIATPDVLIFDLSEYRPQFIVLATDGLWNSFTSEAAVSVIENRFNQSYFGAMDLTRLSILWGSSDNTSIMVINLKNYAWPEKKPMEKKSRSLISAFSSKRSSKSSSRSSSQTFSRRSSQTFSRRSSISRVSRSASNQSP